MYLKSITIVGFKSFAKKSELEFSAPITAIVGPNGSGKSNVAEAFRFVLGEQSFKFMRGRRGEDLIWGGSEAVARGNRAAVEIAMDNTRRQFPLDFDEVRIERVVHRSGENEYRLNGLAVRLRDIQELLASVNIGSTGHHIISQGEADRILSASSRERREMVEDALGLKAYQLKKLEAKRKLEKTEANMAQVESLRREAAPHLRYLKKQIEKAERSLEIQKRLQGAYAEYLKREDTYLAHHADRLDRERRAPMAELAAVKEAIVSAQANLRDDESAARAAATAAAKESLRAARAVAQELLKKRSQLDGEIGFLERRLSEEKNRAERENGQPLQRAEVEAVAADIERQVERALKKEDPAHLKRALLDVVHCLKAFLVKTKDGEKNERFIRDNDELEKLKHSRDALLQKEVYAVESEKEAQAAYDAARAESERSNLDFKEAERQILLHIGRQREIEMTLERIDRERFVIERDRDEFKRELEEAVALLGRGAASYFTHEIKDGERALSAEEIAGEKRERQHERRRELEKLKIRLEELGSGATNEVMKEYQEAKERDEFLAREIADLTASVEKLRALIAELEAQLHEQFAAGIEKISVEFNRFFVLMFGGGEAGLKRVRETARRQEGDEEENDGMKETEAEVGLELLVKLPNKRVRGLEMLSGGERALTSIALIFAMSQVNPPPFIILDETDAALDEANSRRYGDLIEELVKKSQLILITHNRETMSRAGILYGITMGGDGVSKLLSIKFDEAVGVAKA
jgi:chromosome segregation protein